MKNGREHRVRLASRTLDILSAIPKTDETFVFPSRRIASNTSFSGFSKAKKALDETSGVPDWRLHDIRRTVSTQMAKLGIPLQAVEKLLTHSSGSLSGVAGIYNRYEYLDEMFDAQVKRENRLHLLS